MAFTKGTLPHDDSVFLLKPICCVCVTGVLRGATRGGAYELRRDLHVGKGRLRSARPRQPGGSRVAEEDRGAGRDPLRAGVCVYVWCVFCVCVLCSVCVVCCVFVLGVCGIFDDERLVIIVVVDCCFVDGFSICPQVACGFAYTAAVTASGELYTWGAGENGRLGLGDVEDRHTPSR